MCALPLRYFSARFSLFVDELVRNGFYARDMVDGVLRWLYALSVYMENDDLLLCRPRQTINHFWAVIRQKVSPAGQSLTSNSQTGRFYSLFLDGIFFHVISSLVRFNFNVQFISNIYCSNIDSFIIFLVPSYIFVYYTCIYLYLYDIAYGASDLT